MTPNTLTRAALLVALVTGGALFTPRTALAQTTAIHNLGRETVKVCAYNPGDTMKLVALRCWTLRAGQVGSWDNRNTAQFSVIVYRPGLLDEYLCQADRLTASFYVTLPCRIHNSDPRPVDARLRVCNQGAGQGVNFVIAYVANRAEDEYRRGVLIHAAEGWWRVESGECVEVALEGRWPAWYRTIMNGSRGHDAPELYIYGETGGIIQRVFEGRERGLSFCINESTRFKREQVLARTEPCRGPELDRVQMLRVTAATWFSARVVRFNYTF
jgi:hypothetical protein